MAKKLFSTYLDTDTFYEFLRRYNAPEEGSMSSRFATAIKNSLIEPVLDDLPEPAGITSEPLGELPALFDLRELHEYRKQLGLSQAGNLNDFIEEILQYLRADPLFETN